MLLAARCEPGGPSVLEGPGIDGSNTEVDAASRLRDYLADSRYPTDSRPARSDTQTDLSRWPGLPAAKSDGARIEGYAGETLEKGSLYIDVAVQVREAGRYSFFSILQQADRPLVVATVTRDLPAGPARVRFEFYGLILREAAAADLQTARSYQLAGVGGERIPNDAELEQLMRGEREESPAGRLELFRKAYETRKYRPAEFTDRVWDAPEKRARIAELEAEVRAEKANQPQ